MMMTKMGKELSLKPNRGRGGTHLGKRSRNSRTSVCWSSHKLYVFGTDVHAAIPYKDEAQADAATNDPHLKLMFRLLKFEVQEEQDSEQVDSFYRNTDCFHILDLDEIQWIVPAKLMPFDMQSQLNVINQFLESPIDLQGKKPSELLKKKPRKRRPRRVDEDGEPLAKKERKKKEEQKYKSATMIEDSDADEDEWAAFFEREKKLAEKTALASAVSGTSGTVRPTGTKKRRRNGEKKRRKRGGNIASESEAEKSGSGSGEEPSVMQTLQQDGEPAPPNEPSSEEPVRRRPRPRKRLRASSPPQSSSPPLEPTLLPNLEDGNQEHITPTRNRLVVSDDEDE